MNPLQLQQVRRDSGGVLQAAARYNECAQRDGSQCFYQIVLPAKAR
jgi:hypothetical protein